MSTFNYLFLAYVTIVLFHIMLHLIFSVKRIKLVFANKELTSFFVYNKKYDDIKEYRNTYV